MLPLIRTRTVGRLLAVPATATALAAFAASSAHADTTAADTGWTVDLSVDADDVNVVNDGTALRLRSAQAGPASLEGAEASGQLVAAPKDFSEPVNRVRAEVAGRTGGVAVEVRGHLGGTAWSEWLPAGSVLPQAVTRVQARITLTGKAAPSVRSVRLTADRVGGPSSRIAAAPLTYRVYATREGLVGGTTANGHVITDRDHFVALPSRRGLSPINTGTYSVRVCKTDGSLCEYAPVWDVGPWNTRDDYWNAARQMWTDLPRGKPEAQAAYQDGYNGGKDEFGRTVANPAGIDLADGTFWDGLKLTNNAWVNVTYLWTGTGAKGVVGTGGGTLNVRAAASTSAAIKGLAANRANVIIECSVRGQSVTGTYGTTDVWNRIGSGHYISDAYTYTGSDDPIAPAC
ncbi:hypothetical protein [Spirillospora sp. NPDC047279]|uniref:hypothetical protein n=1 Tax=Spirillospora sp. NPDC047279 TaxID=3155478 RepID=UPI0033DA85ED